MQVAFFSAHLYNREYFEHCSAIHHFTFIEKRLTAESAQLAAGHQAVCVFVHDQVDEKVLRQLASLHIGLVIVRSSGAENVDFEAAEKYGITVKWLPGYSPEAIAEHATALLLALNRKTHLAYQRMQQGDFSIEGLTGFNLYRKTVGVIGMGRVGYAFARIMKGFGCTVLAYDMNENESIAGEGVEYAPLPDILKRSDIISLHCSLNNSNTEFLNKDTLGLMKPGAVLINTARGSLVDAKAVLEALRNKQLGAYGADVYQYESGIYHHTFSSIDEVNDPLLRELLSEPNVLLTAHQAFLTKEAMRQIAKTVVNELDFFESNLQHTNQRLIV